MVDFLGFMRKIVRSKKSAQKWLGSVELGNDGSAREAAQLVVIWADNSFVGANRSENPMHGTITTRHLVTKAPLIISQFGLGAYFRCVTTLMMRRNCTFLECVVRISDPSLRNP